MELPVARQLSELVWALIVGMGFGLVFDLLRPLRRGRVTTGLTDALWCLILLAGLLGFALYAGRGRLRLFALLAMAVSGGLWLWLVSPVIRQAQQSTERTVVKFSKKVGRFFEKK